ncbi:amylosucrase [Subtercola boreus]|uniref:Amylosucrase n=1 Tax=Subtercola boreus TaxID=120213 RepID=A0A3E0WAX1_9MICO|nr:amylosucrase [Subtercola boreus]RFA21184.1 amylosucrase [Subtercola boreus]RFA21567.1 amylosucrase [Subtercola boreus]RFA27537.1 amylosucrase [Subtercola boreus]
MSIFDERLSVELPRLQTLFDGIYGDDRAARAELAALVDDLRRSWAERSPELRRLDDAHEADPVWFSSNQMLGGVCYVDLYAGTLEGVRARIPYFRELGLTYLHLMPLFLAPAENSDGGYAVSSYRDIDPALGTMPGFEALAAELRENGISLVVDFVFNHTSNEHLWAKRALARDPLYEDFYLIFQGRDMPDRYEATVREIFPDDHPGSFVPLPDGRWVWATFHSFQWDLNYENPAVFRAMANELLFLANRGVNILRMDAVAFIWKKLGTTSENLPEAHLLLQAFNAVCRIGAPSLLFKSEAIVHPDEVAVYIRPDECQLSYNPLQMALIWNSLATREVNLLAQALEERHALPAHTAWVNYVRSHDDIGWTFSDDDARVFGIDGFEHRRFLNAFYVDRYPGSFARGVPFQDNPRTGDCRISGTTASLAGLEAGDPGAVNRIVLAHSIILSTGGIPLIYLGDEVGQLNDYASLELPGHAGDSRWVGRPAYPAARYLERTDATTEAGALYARFRQLIETRKRTTEFAGGHLVAFHTHNPHVLGYQRGAVLVLANFSEHPEALDAERFGALPTSRVDLVTNLLVDLSPGLTLGPHEFVWLGPSPAFAPSSAPAL